MERLRKRKKEKEEERKIERALKINLLLYHLPRLLDILLVRNTHLLMADDGREKLPFTKACQKRFAINFISTIEGKIEPEGQKLLCFNLVNLSASLFIHLSIVYLASSNILCCDISIDIGESKM